MSPIKLASRTCEILLPCELTKQKSILVDFDQSNSVVQQPKNRWLNSVPGTTNIIRIRGYLPASSCLTVILLSVISVEVIELAIVVDDGVVVSSVMHTKISFFQTNVKNYFLLFIK